MSSWPNNNARPEQGWTVALALCAAVPPLIVLAILQGWFGADIQFFFGVYIVLGPMCLGFAIWALIRAMRTLRSLPAAGNGERVLAIVAALLSAPIILVSALFLLGSIVFALDGGGG